MNDGDDLTQGVLHASAARVLRYAAFTYQGRGGNPAGVLLDAADLDDSVRLAVAAQVGYSETAFVEAQGGDRQYRMRFFSALAEVAFCGHATIAAAVAITDRDGPGLLQFSTVAGLVAVQTRVTPEGTTATLTSVPTHTRPAQTEELDRALSALGWHHSDLDPIYPAHVAYGGNEHLVLAVRERPLLAGLNYDFPSLGTLMAQQAWTTVQLVWAESPTVFHARDPFPPGGVIEDPATGAAAAAFGGYLRTLGLVDVPGHITILQGEDMGHPSRLLVHLSTGDDRVEVTGTAAPITSVGT